MWWQITEKQGLINFNELMEKGELGKIAPVDYYYLTNSEIWGTKDTNENYKHDVQIRTWTLISWKSLSIKI